MKGIYPMFPQSDESKEEAWRALDIPVLAHVFMNAAGRINGDIDLEQKPLAMQVGLYVDAMELFDDRASLANSLNTMVELSFLDDKSGNDIERFIHPIFNALDEAKIEPGQQVSAEEIARAVKDVKLPETEIKKQDLVVLF